MEYVGFKIHISRIFPYTVPNFFSVAMFSNDLCRPIIFKFEGTSSVKGISGNRYTLDDMFFANSTKNPDNWCFEAPKDWKRTNDNTSERLQFPSGVYNVGLCQFNSSAFISQPHFLHADEFYVNQFINGSLKPDEKKHETSIVIGIVGLFSVLNCLVLLIKRGPGFSH